MPWFSVTRKWRVEADNYDAAMEATRDVGDPDEVHVHRLREAPEPNPQGVTLSGGAAEEAPGAGQPRWSLHGQPPASSPQPWIERRVFPQGAGDRPGTPPGE